MFGFTRRALVIEQALREIEQEPDRRLAIEQNAPGIPWNKVVHGLHPLGEPGEVPKGTVA